MLLYRFEKKATTIAGEWQDSAIEQAGHYLSQILVIAKTPINTFDVDIIDYAGRVIRRFETCTGILNDLTATPVSGIVTIKIYNAAIDEDFEVMLCFTTD